MPANKINQKWYVWILIGFVFASLVNDAYSIYALFTQNTFESTGQITLNVIVNIFASGFLPALICYLCGSILYSMLWRRKIRFMSRSDFIYLVLLFTGAAKLFTGIIDVFSILYPAIDIYVSLLGDVIILSASLYIMYFAIIRRKYDANPKQDAASFNILSGMYLTFLGIFTLLPCFGIFILNSDSPVSQQYLQIMEDYLGYSVRVGSNELASAIAAISVFAAIVIATVIVSSVLSKKAKGYVEPPPEIKGGDDSNPFDFPFGDATPREKEKVFDEFDI